MRRLLTAAATLALAGVALAGTTATASAAGGTHRCTQGDPPITASWRTSCALAANGVNEFANYGRCRRSFTEWVYSSRTGKGYGLRFTRSYRRVTVTGPNGIWFRFSSDPFCYG